MSLVKVTEPAVTLLAALRSLFSEDVQVAVTELKTAAAPLFPVEAAAMASALPARRREFAAGRTAARLALGQACAIGMAPDRSPIWPAGWRGSIAHNMSFAVAAVTQLPQTLGVDIESALGLDEDLIPSICDQDEIQSLAGMESALAAKLIFSAKEAAYKAQYPQSLALFGFDHLRFRAVPETQDFVLTFVQDTAPFAAGDQINGRYKFAADQMICAVTLPERG